MNTIKPSRGPKRLLGRRQREDEHKLLPSTAEDDLESGPAEAEVPGWIRDVDLTKSDVAQIQQKKAELSKMHTKHLRVGFGDEDYHKEEVNMLTDQLQQLFRNCERRIQNIGTSADPNNKQDMLIRKNVQTSLATELHALSSTFRKDQQAYMGRLKGQEERTKGYATPAKSGDDFFDEGFNSMQLATLESHENIAAEREAEITKISESITELANMFKELAVLVIDQGTIIDRIDYNVEEVQRHTSDANKQLRKAHENAKNGKLMGCIVCLSIAVAVMALLLVLKIVGKFSP